MDQEENIKKAILKIEEAQTEEIIENKKPIIRTHNVLTKEEKDKVHKDKRTILNLILVVIGFFVYYQLSSDIINDNRRFLGRIDDLLLFYTTYYIVLKISVRFAPIPHVSTGLMVLFNILNKSVLACYIVNSAILLYCTLGKMGIKKIYKILTYKPDINRKKYDLRLEFYAYKEINDISNPRFLWMCLFILYMSPIDVIPDAIPVIGTLDDLAASQFIFYKYVEIKSGCKGKIKLKNSLLISIEHIISSLFEFIPFVGILLNIIDFKIMKHITSREAKYMMNQAREEIL